MPPAAALDAHAQYASVLLLSGAVTPYSARVSNSPPGVVYGPPKLGPYCTSQVAGDTLPPNVGHVTTPWPLHAASHAAPV